MKYLGINTGESCWSRSWKALQLHLPNTGKMNDRANIAGSVVLTTNLLLINTKLPSNPPYISLSAHTPQRRPAQTSGKEKDHQDLASLPRAAPPARHFSQLPAWCTRVLLPPELPTVEELPGKHQQNIRICSWSKAFSSVDLLESSCWGVGMGLIKQKRSKIFTELYFGQRLWLFQTHLALWVPFVFTSHWVHQAMANLALLDSTKFPAPLGYY